MPSYQAIFARPSAQWSGFVSEWVTRANTNFFICFQSTRSRLHTVRFWSLSRVISVFVGLYKKIFCFLDWFVQKMIQQPDGSCEVSFYKNLSRNSPLKSAIKYEKDIVSREYCIALHDDKACFQPNCRYHIKLIGDWKKLLRKLDVFCFQLTALSVYTFQLPIQWHKCCKEWTSFW